MKFMMLSNIFMFIPVISAAWMHEWIYFVIALGSSIFSPIYHYLKEYNSGNAKLVHIIKNLDWLFAISSYSYMYYFIFTKVDTQFQTPLALALSFTMVFFWYGFKLGNYKKTHPWFHVITSVVSGLIVLSK